MLLGSQFNYEEVLMLNLVTKMDCTVYIRVWCSMLDNINM